MIVRPMTAADAALAIHWMTQRIRSATGRNELSFPADFAPQTGLVCLVEGTPVCVVMLYLERNTPVAVCGWCIADPRVPARRAHAAIELLLSTMPGYAKKMGAKHLLTTFGSRSLNRILDRLGFLSGDRHIQQKYQIL